MNALAASLLARRLAHVRKFRQLSSQIDTAMRVLLQYAIVGSLMLLPERFIYATLLSIELSLCVFLLEYVYRSQLPDFSSAALQFPPNTSAKPVGILQWSSLVSKTTYSRKDEPFNFRSL
jgi:hypothetical protein